MLQGTTKCCLVEVENELGFIKNKFKTCFPDVFTRNGSFELDQDFSQGQSFIFHGFWFSH